ncbi:tetratricopeptide repeat protein [Streptantibioticus silvisoli]|uniref:Tetratricopeptide repeat protein n=1 Tax=Streptantibioticus silvisoli TaxID=2705255 RepID=A0ABT6W743_9ACTN|nr:tetratricopeptide repeat protein [Streptantibioticus silvisoli]MDI5966554.1 tetratricopeptide repeat protein [Streptantibioticus silvisoli]
MVDVMSVTAISTVLGAVGSSVANEAGRAVWESAGSVVRRIAGREVPAPRDADERADVARLVADRLRQDPALAGVWARFARSVPEPRPGLAEPDLLPAATRFFSDRQDPMRVMDRELGRRADGTPRIVLLYGPEGIGTSELAVHWGQLTALKFPHGRLYADLRGGSAGEAVDPASVLRRFLRKLGVGDDGIPPGRADLAERFRAEVAGRRLLVVLDHVHSAAQALPFLTSAPGVFTVVVARRPLTGLDAVPVPVGPLTDRDAKRLLTDLAGRPAVAAAKAALPSVLARCGGSPYALRAAVPRLADPVRPTAAVDGDPVRAAAEDAYRALAPDAARCYRLLACRPWPRITAGPAAAALGVPAAEADRLLAAVAGAGLLEAVAAGGHRYRPAVRRHAELAAVRQDGVAVCAAAAGRMVAWYLEFAVAADRAAHPDRWWLGPRYASVAPGPYAGQSEALAAAVSEVDCVVEAVRTADELGDRDTVWQLCEALYAAQLRAGRHDEVLPALRIGVRAADAVAPGTEIAGRMHTQLAMALTERAEWDAAESELRAAARAERRAGHARGQATAVETLGLLRLRQWRFAEAYDLFGEAYGLLDGVRDAARGAADAPRARALLERHRGRALSGLGRWAQGRERAGVALAFFREHGDVYNTGRTLSDLARLEWQAGRPDAALPLIDEAVGVLTPLRATFHVERLRLLREAVVSA